MRTGCGLRPGGQETDVAARIGTTEPARVKPIIPLLNYQREDVDSEARFRWNCWARQTGKSFTKSLRRILRGLRRKRTQIFLSAGERQSRELMQKARQHREGFKISTDYYDNRFLRDLSIKQLEIPLCRAGTNPDPLERCVIQPWRLSLSRGGSPRQGHLWPHHGFARQSSDGARRTGDVFLDEFAMHAFDRDIWAAMFPTLLRGQGGH